MKNIFARGELEEKSNVQRMSHLDKPIKFYNLYEEYRVTQDRNFISDFDKEIKRITGKKDG